MKEDVDLIIQDSTGEADWYEASPGYWSTSSSQLSRIEMGIKEIIWKIRREKNGEVK